MSKHHHLSREEQINSKIYDEALSRKGGAPYRKAQSNPTKDVQEQLAAARREAWLRDYQIN